MVTIRYVVMSVLNRLGDYSMKQYLRFTQIGIECFSEDLSPFHIGAGLQVIYGHMSTAKTLPLPSDYIQWQVIGYPIGGKLRVITHDKRILLPRIFDDTGEAVGNYYGAAIGSDIISNAIFFSDHYRNGRFVGGLYGLPGGIDEASFRIDMENRQIVFSGETPRSEVVMEYFSTGLKSDGSSLIPRNTVASLRAYILWQKDENDPRIPNTTKARLKRNYEEEIEALRSFENSFTKDEYLSMIYSTSYQGPKR